MRIETEHDPVNHPQHYTNHPSGIECIDVTEHMNFCLGNAVKYIWRADLKNGTEDLEKAVWYIQREIARRTPKPVTPPKHDIKQCDVFKTFKEYINEASKAYKASG